MTSSSLDETQLPKLRNSQQERVARRVAELFDNDAQFRAAAPIPEVIEAACTPGLRLTEVLRRSSTVMPIVPRLGNVPVSW